MENRLKIEEIHINEAYRIIKSFHFLNNDLEKYYDYLETLKTSVLDMKNNLDKIVKSNEPGLKKQSNLLEMINEHEIKINEQNLKIKPVLDNIDILKKDSFKLYSLLKDKYPGATDLQLKESLNSYLTEIKKENL